MQSTRIRLLTCLPTLASCTCLGKLNTLNFVLHTGPVLHRYPTTAVMVLFKNYHLLLRGISVDKFSNNEFPTIKSKNQVEVKIIHES